MKDLRGMIQGRLLNWGQLGTGVLGTAMLLALTLGVENLHCLAWIAFAPILRTTKGVGFVKAFSASLVAIVVTIGLLGRQGALNRLVESSSPGWMTFQLSMFALSICGAVGAWGSKATRDLPIWVFAGLATLLEACLLVQLPTVLEPAQFQNVVLLQIVAFAGIWLLSFALWLSNFFLATLTRPKMVCVVLAVVPLSMAATRTHWRIDGERVRFGEVQLSDFAGGSPPGVEDSTLDASSQLASWNQVSPQAGASGSGQALCLDPNSNSSQSGRQSQL